jgi:2-haloacid dehalogenase
MKKLIVFDAYGTLFDVYSIARQAEQLFPSHGMALANLWRDKQIEYTRLISLSDPSNPLGSAHFEPFWDLTQKALAYSCERMKLTLTAQAREQLMMAYDHLSPFEENEEVLKTLKTLGRQTAILSNANVFMLERVIEHAKLTHYFDQVISIESVRQFKTHPRSYGLVHERFSLEAKEILFVSSNAWDALGATWFGWDTFWLNRQGLPDETLGPRPAYTGASLKDLLHFID